MKAPLLLVAACFALASALPASGAADIPTESPEAAILRLRAEVSRHDELYFRQGAPEISDFEYDALKRQLQELEAKHPTLAPGIESTANTVGDDRTGRHPTARHRAPMLGLEKSYTEVELRKFLNRVVREVHPERVTWIIEPKYDGLAISLLYERGRLIRAITRGNGVEGDLVTERLLATTELPRQLSGADVPELVEIRGEVFMEQAEFERINAERLAAGASVHAHPRNLAVGTLKSTDAERQSSRRLSLVVFGWGDWQPLSSAPVSEQDFLRRGAAWGFVTPETHVASGPETIWGVVRAMESARLEYPAPLDGLVIKVDQKALREQLGESRTAPRWAVAFKFEPERVETRLLGITLQVGRTGAITPVAELDPVAIGGTTIARATLHNRREVERRDYRIGDTVRLERAGDVIPQLVGVNLAARPEGSRPFEFPGTCPSCGTALLAEREVGLRCPLRECPAQIKRRIEHLASDAGLRIRGLGPALAADLVDRGLVREIDDLFRLREEKLPAGVREQLEQSRRAEWWRWIAALGLPEIGPANARKLAAHFADWEDLAGADSAGLRAAGLTEAAARVLAAELERAATQRLLGALSDLEIQPTRENASGAMMGKTFVFTGTLRAISRTEAERRIRTSGGRVQTAVTRGTHFLVTGTGGGKKLEEARRLGVVVLSEEEFITLLAAP